jgi:hypothetical protein
MHEGSHWNHWEHIEISAPACTHQQRDRKLVTIRVPECCQQGRSKMQLECVQGAGTVASKEATEPSAFPVGQECSSDIGCSRKHLMPGRMQSDIKWDCPPIDTWSSSSLKKFGIERRQIIRDLQSPQMPRTKWTAALQRAMKPLALLPGMGWTMAGRLLSWQSHRQAAREH